MRMQTKLNSLQTILTQNPLRYADLHPSTATSGAICFVCQCVNNTAYTAFVSPETVSTDGVSWQRQPVTVRMNASDEEGFISSELSLPGASGVCERACRYKDQMHFRV